MQNTVHIETLISDLPCQYQNIYGHPEYDETVLGIDTIKNGEKIADIINQYKKLTGKTTIKVLDIGCAQGYYSLKAAELGCKVVGIDLEEKNIAICKYLNRENKFSVDFRKEFLDYDFVKNIQDDEYDFIFLFSVIHHLCQEEVTYYKGYGYNYAISIMKELSKKCKILLGVLATREETLHWAKYLPNSYNDFLKDFAFSTEINYVFIPYQKTFRPFIFASNYYSINKNNLILGVDKNLQTDYLHFRTSDRSLTIRKELVFKYPELVIGYMNKFLPKEDIKNYDFHFEDYNFTSYEKYFKDIICRFKKNTLGIICIDRYCALVCTKFELEKDKLIIKRKILGTKYNNPDCDLVLTLKDSNRVYVDTRETIPAPEWLDLKLHYKEQFLNFEAGANILSILQNQTSEEKFLNELEIFIGEVLLQFNQNCKFLKSIAFDCTAENCLKLPNMKYHFFDYEFELRNGIDKSYMVYRIIMWACILCNRNNKLEEYFVYFIQKYNLEDKYHWCEYYDRYLCHMFLEKRYEGEYWKAYHNSYYVKSIRTLSKLCTLFIPIKRIRRNYREKLIKYFAYPNNRIVKHFNIVTS